VDSSNENVLQRIFGTAKPLIGMLHAAALPGRPSHDRAGGMDAIIAGLRYDLEILQTAGVDGLLFCNEMDIPYQLRVDHEVSAAMSFAIGALKSALRLPFGIDVAWDPHASLAVARATGARFARGVFTGVYDTDMGLMNPSFGDIAAYREMIGAGDVAIFSNVTPEFGASISGRPVESRVRGAAFLGVDGLIVSGAHTGLPTDPNDVREAKSAARQVPVLVSSGVTLDDVLEMLDIADGVIVGTSLKVDGALANPMDPERVSRMVAQVREWRATTGSAS
jgi:membrane complex biogenesis BtpA family protein